jgi:hypothetical protein
LEDTDILQFVAEIVEPLSGGVDLLEIVVEDGDGVCLKDGLHHGNQGVTGFAVRVKDGGVLYEGTEARRIEGKRLGGRGRLL